MRKSFYLIPALALVLASCGGQKAGQNQESEANNVEEQEVEIESADHITKKVNWDKPIFALDENGDTIRKWIYNDKGQLIESVNKLMDETIHYTYDDKGNRVSSDMIDGEEFTYDEQGRLKTYSDGFRDASYREFEYEGNLRKTIESTAYGNNLFYLTYFLDEEMKYDTLDLMMRNSFENDWESKVESKYVEILGKKYLSVRNEYHKRDGVVTLDYKTEYEYNNIGANTKIIFTNKAGEVDITEIETQDNWKKQGVTKTYYSWE